MSSSASVELNGSVVKLDVVHPDQVVAISVDDVTIGYLEMNGTITFELNRFKRSD